MATFVGEHFVAVIILLGHWSSYTVEGFLFSFFLLHSKHPSLKKSHKIGHFLNSNREDIVRIRERGVIQLPNVGTEKKT